MNVGYYCRMQIYLVGGAVRDEQLDIPHSERDWCVVGATPDEMLGLGFQQVGKDVPVFLHPETREEYALARKERKTAPGYHGFAFDFSPNVSIEEDLLRRDLTINAMAKDADGNLIDPSGGMKDIRALRLRHVSDAFSEDPVRILRVAKFAARLHPHGFQIAAETLDREFHNTPRPYAMLPSADEHRRSERLPLSIQLLGHGIAAMLGLAIGYYILCWIRPESNVLNLDLPGIERPEDNTTDSADS